LLLRWFGGSRVEGTCCWSTTFCQVGEKLKMSPGCSFFSAVPPVARGLYDCAWCYLSRLDLWYKKICNVTRA
jgi:hypothetical protein